MLEVLKNRWETSGFAQFFLDPDGWKSGIMILIAFALLYMAIKKQFEPLLLLPIAFGMLLTNLPWPGGGIFHPEWFEGDINWAAIGGQYHDAAGNHIDPGLFDFLYIGVKMDIFPCLIFMAVGAMTDFGPLLSNPVSLLLGAAAQLGVYCAFLLAMASGEFSPQEAASIAIIGGADGPTAIFLT